jgi:SAM-dependent methyltransferase
MSIDPRELAINLLAAFPPLRAALRRIRDRDRAVDHEAIVQVALDSLATRERFFGSRLQDADVLEIGSGRSVCLALLLLARGARRVVNVEIDPYGVCLDPALYRLLVRRAGERGVAMSWPPLGLQSVDGERVEPDPSCFTLYLGRSAEHVPEADESFDITISLAVLEHVLPEAMPEVARELRRLTRRGGGGWHRVDLVDHFHRHDEPFRFLRWSERAYRWMYSNRGSASNRFRLSDLERIYRDAGFDVSFEDVQRFEDVERFERWRAEFHPDFRDRDPDELRALQCMLVIADPAPAAVRRSEPLAEMLDAGAAS